MPNASIISIVDDDASVREGLADLVGSMGHQAHFARAFKDSQGVAPHRYILECRVKRTQELLATDLPLSEIAVEVGFSDQSHLTRWFREFVGVTPGSYRWSMR